jgi:hypothetical protein
MSNYMRDPWPAIRKTVGDKVPGFTNGIQIEGPRIYLRKVPDWAKDDATVREVLLRVFPRMNDKTSSQYQKQRERAGIWMRFIQIYWRCGQADKTAGFEKDENGKAIGVVVSVNSHGLQGFVDDVNGDRHGKPKMTLAKAKALRNRILRAGSGLRTDGSGARRPPPKRRHRRGDVSAAVKASIL